MSTTIQGARIVSPGIDLPAGEIAIDDGGRITAMGAGVAASGDRIDASGLIAVPGFIDMHTHGANGADVSDGGEDSVATLARAKLREGVTTFLPTTMSLPDDETLGALDRIAAYMKAPVPTAAKIPGLHLEGPYLNPNRAGAQNPAVIREPNAAELDRYLKRAPIRIVSLAPELPGALDAIGRCHRDGVIVSLAHTAASHAEASAALDAGARHLTHFGNQMSALHHREIGMVGTGFLDRRCSLELIPDLIHLAPEMVELVFRLKPLDQIMLITDSMAASGMGDGEFALGGLDVTVAAGQARLHDGTLAGSTLAMNQGLANVVATTGLPLADVIGTTSANQATALGLEGLGHLKVGARGDIVLLDESFAVRAVFLDGIQQFSSI